MQKATSLHPTRRTQSLIAAAVRSRLSELSDSDVVFSYTRGEARAFDELVRRYQPRLINFVYRKIGDAEKARDVVQEVFIRVFRRSDKFDRSKKFSTWIYTIASNLAKNELRNRQRNPVILVSTIKGNWEDEDRPLQFEDFRSRPDDMFHKRQLRRLVEDAVSRMRPNFQAVFVLRELEGKSYEEMTEILGVNLGTVKSRLNRARNSFAAIIGPKLN